MLRPVNDSDSAVVEQAKGALMLRYGIGSRESLAVLERWALDAGAPVHDVADALVNGICLGRVAPEADGMVRWLEQRLRGDVSEVRATAAEPAPLLSPGAVAAPIPAPRPGTTPATGHRQWRYTSAVHAARVLRSR
jgi:hypothetical protein